MPTPTSRIAYKRYYEILDQALDSKAGINILCTTLGDANQLRIRLNRARTLDRQLSCEIYEATDPKHGYSIYDNLIIKTKGDEDWGEVTIIHEQPIEIEEIAV